ncbi:hypothetical protein R1sor_000126 [Riccia sorocarpa]|uniref:Uncharacterized protein n=1 Tax=Riccia sorocarpa TaxID=122646 RepID=A0ABD3GW83_9MARC
METTESEVANGIIDTIRYHIPFPEVYKRQKLDTRLEWPILDRLHQVARKWPTYCPAFLQSGELFGFDRSSNSWHTVKLKHMQDIPEDKFVRVEAIEGALAVVSMGTKLRSSNFGAQPLELWEGYTTCLRVVNLVSGKGRAISDAYPESLDWLDYVRPAHGTNQIYILEYSVGLGAHSMHLWAGASSGSSERRKRVRIAISSDELIRVLGAKVSKFDNENPFYHEERWLRESLKSEFKPLDEMHVKWFDISALRCGTRIFVILIVYGSISQNIDKGGTTTVTAQIKLYRVDSNFQLVELSTTPTPLSPGPLSRTLLFKQITNASTFVVLAVSFYWSGKTPCVLFGH